MNRNNNIADREKALKEFLLRFKEEEKVTYDEFLRYLEEVYKPKPVEKPGEPAIPVSVFDNEYLSALEAIVKYLRENKSLKFSEIARLISRDQRAIGVTYRFARKKMTTIIRAPVVKYSLPLSVVADRKLSVLEGIVYYLKKKYSLSYHDIALLLRRDDRTVWTVYKRALKKL